MCTFLSGGLDPSVLTALAVDIYRARGETLSTYSSEYEGNKHNFKESLFQPHRDDDYAKYLAEYLKTDHTVLTAPNEAVAECLTAAANARDFPGQADIDSSLLYYCSRVQQRHTVALSGECADEIFGGYLWFYRPDMLHRDFFPWIHEPMKRANIFKKEFVNPAEGYRFLSDEYRKVIRDCPTLPNDSDAMRTSRIATCLSVHYFMTSFLERIKMLDFLAQIEYVRANPHSKSK